MTKWSSLRSAFAALALAAGMAPASALTLRDVEVTCPIDGQKFMHKAINSYTQFGVRLDMRPHGALMAPAPLPVCPGNRFVVYRTDFAEAEIAALKAYVATAEYKAQRTAHTDYYIWAKLEERFEKPAPWKLAQIYLRAAWQAENGDVARHQSYLALARDKFDAALPSLEHGTANWLTAKLLAAELDRQLGRFAEAEARLAELAPMTFPDKPPLKSVHAQIGRAVAERDSKPRNMTKD